MVEYGTAISVDSASGAPILLHDRTKSTEDWSPPRSYWLESRRVFLFGMTADVLAVDKDTLLPEGLLDWMQQGWTERNQSADVTFGVEMGLLLLSRHNVHIERPAEVRDYLTRHPDITNLLTRFTAMAQDAFGTRTRMALAVYRDREVDDEYLTIYIDRAGAGKDVLARIERIYTSLSEDLAHRSGWILVTPDFREHRE
jgi:hypothetical protein